MGGEKPALDDAGRGNKKSSQDGCIRRLDVRYRTATIERFFTFSVVIGTFRSSLIVPEEISADRCRNRLERQRLLLEIEAIR